MNIIYTIVVTYNGAQWVDKCFGSLIASQVEGEHLIIAVDNLSTDNTLNLIKSNYPLVQLIENKRNLGFGQANNIGIREAYKCGADYVFLLNQDAWVEKTTIQDLVSLHEKHQQFGIISPIQYNKNRKIERQFAKYMPKAKSDSEIEKVDFVNAASWLIPRKVLETVGLFDPLFFHYGEDNHYINRVLYYGFVVGIASKISIVHDRNEINKPSTFNYELVIKNMMVNINHSLLYNHFVVLRKSVKFFMMGIVNADRSKFTIWVQSIFSILRNYKPILECRSRAKSGLPKVF
jgi:GT2 family glycosyltransferase